MRLRFFREGLLISALRPKRVRALLNYLVYSRTFLLRLCIVGGLRARDQFFVLRLHRVGKIHLHRGSQRQFRALRSSHVTRVEPKVGNEQRMWFKTLYTLQARIAMHALVYLLVG